MILTHDLERFAGLECLNYINDMIEDELLDIGMIHKEVDLVQASKGKRFTNYIIDQILAILFMIAVFIIFIAAGLYDIEKEQPLVDQLFALLVFLSYYTFTEGFLNGKTVGKYITKTRAVNQDGSRPEFKAAFLRSLSRLVPFEPFSFLGDAKTGWHDRWTKTLVIDEQLTGDY